MRSRRIQTLVFGATFILALTGMFLAGYSILVEDPFSTLKADAGIDDLDGNKSDPGSDPSMNNSPIKVDNEDQQDTPSWILPVVGTSALLAILFVAASGNLYLKSKRGENIVRADLLDLITINPGINLSSIRRELELSQGAVSYHIMKLEKMGKIFSDKGSKERRYYPSSMGYQAAMKQAHLDEIDSILSNDTSRNIVDLLKDGPCSQNDLVNYLNISPSTVHWHMERMKKVGMINKEQKGRSVFYQLEEMPPRNT